MDSRGDVLILEPDALQRDLIVMALRRNGFRSVVCESAADVSSFLLEHKPALFILDIYQADINGLDLLEGLRQAGLMVLTRVIVISSMGFSEIVRRATQLGAADFLVKPLDSDLLIARIGKVLEARAEGQ